MRRGQPGRDWKTGLAAAPFFVDRSYGSYLVADDLDDPAPVARAVELHEEHALPSA
jgi:hypothetical protein